MLDNVNFKLIDTHMMHLFNVGKPANGGSFCRVWHETMKAFDRPDRESCEVEWLFYVQGIGYDKRKVVFWRNGKIDVYPIEEEL